MPLQASIRTLAAPPLRLASYIFTYLDDAVGSWCGEMRARVKTSGKMGSENGFAMMSRLE